MIGCLVFPGSQAIGMIGCPVFPGSQGIEMISLQYFQALRLSKRFVFFAICPGSQVIEEVRFSICPGSQVIKIVHVFYMSMFPSHQIDICFSISKFTS